MAHKQMVDSEDARAAQRTAQRSDDTSSNTSSNISTHQSLPFLNALKFLTAGGVAGGVARTAVAPLSRLKVLVQVSSHQVEKLGVVAGLQRILQTEGVRGLYVGNGADCIRIIPHSAAKFLLYEQFTSLAAAYFESATAPHSQHNTPLVRMACGASAGILAGTLTYPLDMIRGRLMVQGPNGLGGRLRWRRYDGVVDAARSIAANEGVMTLYRGWLPSFVGTILYSGLKFGVYGTLKDVFAQHASLTTRDGELLLAPKLAAGAIAGGVGQTVAYPMEVIRRRLQAGDWAPYVLELAGGRKVVVRPGMTSCVLSLLRTEGLGALYKGLSLNYIRVVPSVAISFATYEAMKELLGIGGGGGGGEEGVGHGNGGMPVAKGRSVTLVTHELDA